MNFRNLAGRLSKPDNVITDFSTYDQYLRDATEQRQVPLALVFAESEMDVIEVARFCSEHHIPIVARGAGTGLSGGCVPVPNGIVLSTERINHLHIDSDRKRAVCGPGVITIDLKNAAEVHGLTYPPDPASFRECTLGGNVAENAGGLRCRRFGVTRDYIFGLKTVTINGELLQTGEYNREASLNLTDVLVGSEGTLAIITEIMVRLIDKPSVGNTILAAFENPKDAAQTVTDITTQGVIPTVMEFMDADAVACSLEYEPSDLIDAQNAMLLFETSGEDAEKQTNLIRQVCEKNRAVLVRVEPDQSKTDSLWQIRRNVSKAIKAAAKAKISEDIAVPNSQIPALIDFVAEMNRTSPLRINSFGHAGDGNIHVNFLSQTGTYEELRLIDEGVEQLLEKTVELGGSITGEHGIGLAKNRYLHLEFDAPTLESMKQIKSVFDPENLLNPGKIFPLKRF